MPYVNDFYALHITQNTVQEDILVKLAEELYTRTEVLKHINLLWWYFEYLIIFK